VIELDGSQHHEPAYLERDRERDARLHSMGLMVLRFDNRQVLLELEGVLAIVRETAIARASKR
jgi:very-short-patch-repair endonuclease